MPIEYRIDVSFLFSFNVYRFILLVKNLEFIYFYLLLSNDIWDKYLCVMSINKNVMSLSGYEILQVVNIPIFLVFI